MIRSCWNCHRLKTWWSNEAVVNLWQVSNSNRETFIIWCVESQVVFILFLTNSWEQEMCFVLMKWQTLLSTCWAPDHEPSPPPSCRSAETLAGGIGDLGQALRASESCVSLWSKRASVIRACEVRFVVWVGGFGGFELGSCYSVTSSDLKLLGYLWK